MAYSTSSKACACLLLLAVVAGAVQASDCPNLFNGQQTGLTDAVVQACSATGTAGCMPCQCSILKAITPQLVQTGKILSSEAWTASALNTLADTMTQCKKDFAVQLLENTQLTLSQLTGLDSCPADVKAVSQCASTQPSTDTAALAAPAPASSSAASPSMFDEVLQEGCAASIADVSSNSSATCPSPAAARVAAGIPMSSSMGSSLLLTPVSSDGAASVLTISRRNTRGPIQWRAGCWCAEVWDPVCDPVTRKQYPNACSAACQMVEETIPCPSLEPLVNKTMAGSTAVFVVDQSLMQRASDSQQAAAFDGPVPPAAPRDTQLFYYYYEDDADDTQDAMDISSTIAEALLAAKYGDEPAAAGAISTALPPAVQAGAAAAANATVTKQDGPANNNTTPAGLLASLRNVTVLRQRFRLERTPEAPQEKRSVPIMPTAAVGSQPANPAWLRTDAPGLRAGVYQRDADRTSRILASLMAAAQEAKDKTQAAQLVINIAPALDNVVRAATGAAQVAQAAQGQPFAGGMFRSAGIPVLATARNAAGNLTAATMNGTASNSTSNSTTARPILRAMEGLASNTGFGQLVEELDGLAASLPALQTVEGLQGQTGMARSALNATGANMTVNGTANGNSTKGNSTSQTSGSEKKRGFRRFLLF